MEHLVIEPDKRKNRYRIVCIGSRVSLGELSMAALKAPPQMKTENLQLEDAMTNKAELEKLIEEKWAHLKRAK